MSQDLWTKADYRRLLDPIVRPDRFASNHGVIAHLLVHFGVVTALGTSVAWRFGEWPLWATILAAIVAGHSIGVLAFASHEVGHGAVLRAGALRTWLERLGWTYVLFTTPTIQRRAHNAAHHRHANTASDPDRRPTVAELAARPGFARGMTWLFPNPRHPVISAVFGFSLAIWSYHVSLLVDTLRASGSRYDLRLSPGYRTRIAREFAWNLAVHGGLWALSGFHPGMLLYFWGAYVVAATVDGLYIATNHLLASQADRHDPVAQTVSLAVPAWLDFLHLRFSHHAEHHLYPGAGTANYPVIRRALLAQCPQRYHAMTFGAALRALLRCPVAIAAPDALSHPDGTGRQSVPVPLPSIAAPEEPPWTTPNTASITASSGSARA